MGMEASSDDITLTEATENPMISAMIRATLSHSNHALGNVDEEDLIRSITNADRVISTGVPVDHISITIRFVDGHLDDQEVIVDLNASPADILVAAGRETECYKLSLGEVQFDGTIREEGIEDGAVISAAYCSPDFTPKNPPNKVHLRKMKAAAKNNPDEVEFELEYNFCENLHNIVAAGHSDVFPSFDAYTAYLHTFNKQVEAEMVKKKPADYEGLVWLTDKSNRQVLIHEVYGEGGRFLASAQWY